MRRGGSPRLGLALLLRALAGGAVVVAMTATAISVTAIREVDRIKDIVTHNGAQAVDIPEVTTAQAGEARTILLLGSDARYSDKKAGLPPRSDTMLVVRIDPKRRTIAAMSIPRDLAVTIPGRGDGIKINEAFSSGGPRLTVRTIQRLFEDASGKRFPINNVLIVNFSSFRRAVDYIDGVYVDVDRRYFNDNSQGGERFAAIDVPAGYQKLRGRKALDYVRYRHGDSDLVRGARQQDFINQARRMPRFTSLLSFSDRERIARAFSRYFQFSRNFTRTKEIFALLRLSLFVAQHDQRVVKLPFPAHDAPNPTIDTRLYSSDGEVRGLVERFMRPPRPAAPPKRSPRQTRALQRPGAVPGLVDATAEGRNLAVLADPKLDFPFAFPRLRLARGSADLRLYRVRRRDRAYRLSYSTGVAGQYYGLQGMTWRHPPILEHPDLTRRVGGRRLSIITSGSHFHVVAWQTKRGVYWVSNTLTDDLSNRQMLAIAGSVRHLRQ